MALLGNHPLQVYWMGVKLHDGWVWIGHHPTLMPKIERPLFDIILPIGGFIFQAVDGEGNPVGARFHVEDLSGRIPPVEQYPEDGLLTVTQIPAGAYPVEASNCSSTSTPASIRAGYSRPAPHQR